MVSTLGLEQEPSLPLEVLSPSERVEFVNGIIPPDRYLGSRELVEAMARLGNVLPDLGLGHLVPFNTAYCSLSAKVCDTIAVSLEPDKAKDIPEEQKFSLPHVVEQTMGIFADLYFRQIRAHLKEEADEAQRAKEEFRLPNKAKGVGVDEAWRPLFYGRAGRKASPGIQFLLGMNAHIVYDLPQALNISGVEQAYYNDYTKTVNYIIDDVANQLSSVYVPGTDWMRRKLTNETVRWIERWREDAWQTGKRLPALEEVEAEKRERSRVTAGKPKGLPQSMRDLLLFLDHDTKTSMPPEASADIAAKGALAKEILGERKRTELRNARAIGTLGRFGLIGAAFIGGKPPRRLEDLTLEELGLAAYAPLS